MAIQVAITMPMALMAATTVVDTMPGPMGEVRTIMEAAWVGGERRHIAACSPNQPALAHGIRS